MNMKKYSLIIITLLMISTAAAFSFSDLFGDTAEPQGEVGIIDLSGPVVPSEGGFTAGTSPDEIRDLNQMVEEQNVDAVIYEINSGGGAVVASKDVKRNIESLNVPTVCRIRDVGASGAYLYSLGCDSIVADSASITGSIGVTSSYLEVSELMENIGVNYVNITAGERKELGSPFEEPTEEEREVLQGKAQLIGDEFLEDVSESRNLTEQQEEQVGTGEIFLGSEAEELGLVDDLGGRNTAINEAENITEKELEPVSIDRLESFNLLDLFLPGLEIGGSDSPIQAVM